MLIYFSPMKKSKSSKPAYQNGEATNSDDTHPLFYKHSNVALSNASESNFKTDIVIKVEDYTFYAHKSTLSSHSPILRMFMDKNETEQIKIVGVKPEVLKLILHYMYSNNLNANCQNIADVYKAAQKLKMKALIDHCIQLFLANNATAYIYRYTVAWNLEMVVEKHKAYKEILKNFEKCALTEEFFNLNISQVCEVLIGLSLDWLESTIDSYYQVYLTALKWLEKDRMKRTRYSINVMTCLPFSKMDKREIVRCFNPPFARDIVQMQPVRNVLISALQKCLSRYDETEAPFESNENN